MDKIEAYVKSVILPYPQNRWWRSRYLMLRGKLEISFGSAQIVCKTEPIDQYSFIVSDGT